MDSIEALAIARRMAGSILSWYLPESMRWHYEDGLFLCSAFELARVDSDEVLVERIRKTYETLVREDGTICSYDQQEYNLDQINPGRLLFDLYDLSGDARYREAINQLERQLRDQPRTLGGNYWHKKIYPWQVWLDGLYMVQPFRSRYALMHADGAMMVDIVRQLVDIEGKTRDAQTGLLYHAWDESRRQLWADPVTGCSPHFWGRALGWYCMAIVDVVSMLPAEVPMMGHLHAIISRLAHTIVAYQDPCGLWHQILDQGGREGNYLETSCSAMFAYFLLRSVRLGLIGEHPYRTMAERALRALAELKTVVDREERLHLVDTCSVAGLGGKPYRDGSFSYYVSSAVATDDFKGVGPFILALAELYRLDALL